eukprot:scaffold79354_cov24-Prasinocladus_malaysianus.AAC.1
MQSTVCSLKADLSRSFTSNQRSGTHPFLVEKDNDRKSMALSYHHSQDLNPMVVYIVLLCFH